jgi:YggT family protein
MWVITKTLWYLLDTVVSAYIMLLLLRLFLQRLHANYYNPLCQFVIRITSPVVKPLQHWLPTWHGMDLAVLTLVVLLTIIKYLLCGWMIYAKFPHLTGLFVVCSGDLLENLIHLFLYLIVGRVILSWMHNAQLAPILEVLYQLTEPFLKRVRKVLPPLRGVDISPLVMILILQLTVITWIYPMKEYGLKIALG